MHLLAAEQQAAALQLGLLIPRPSMVTEADGCWRVERTIENSFVRQSFVIANGPGDDSRSSIPILDGLGKAPVALLAQV
jgi:hypothetical protein